jgi:glycosyltransferase involved in cell wall biosynthesis
MKIGIDVSQVVYEGTGVGRYVRELIPVIIRLSPEDQFILFGSSLRQQRKLREFMDQIKKQYSNVVSVFIPLPPSFLDILWNKLHILPITWFTGSLDIFWSSDWTQPPLGIAKGVTTIHDLSFLRFPESFHKKIIEVHKRRLHHAKKECSHFLCDSEATKADVIEYAHIPADKCTVVYPGVYGK